MALGHKAKELQITPQNLQNLAFFPGEIGEKGPENQNLENPVFLRKYTEN